MGSAKKELNNELVDAGNRLLMSRPSSVDGLLMLLEKAESILTKVEQNHPKSTEESLLPIMKALITDELLLHPEVNIQIAVACCMNELTRITAPQAPYPEDKMKVVFKLFMVALKQLSSESASDYSIPLKILETVATYRTCLLMMDVDSELIVEMFQLFLNSIRSDHPYDIFNYMEIIMTMVIEESDEISFELLEPLLASVRMVNMEISPISFELGETVIVHLATKLQPYLIEAVKSMHLDPDDYDEIVISLCQITSIGENVKPRRSPDELVNSRIQIWWPKDKTFHTCTVTAFDPVTEKHTISYDDDVIKSEKLNLRKERWKLFSDKQPLETHIAQTEEEAVRYHPSPAKEPFHPSCLTAMNASRSCEKTMKRKALSSNKQHASSSSKRSKSESRGFVKSVENSASNVIHVIDDLEEETRETNTSFTCLIKCDVADPHTQVTKKLKGESFDPVTPGRCSLNKTNCTMVEEEKEQRRKISTSPIPTDPKISVNQDCNEMVDINGYKVKATSVPILEAIFAKYGNIAANSLFKSKSMTASLLEVVCDIVLRLQNYSVDDILLDLEAIENEVSVVEAAKIETSWLRHHLAKLHEVSALHKENLLLKKSKVNVSLVIEAANEKL